MLFYSIIFLSIFIPLIASKKAKNKALFISALLLFIPWGLQFEITQDWEPHLSHWNVANNGASQVLLQREVEPLYGFLLQLCNPLSFFGFLVFSTIIHIWILFFMIKKNIPSNYYWASIAVLMLTIENGLLIVNSNRQSWALMVTILGTLIIYGQIKVYNPFPKYWKKWYKEILGFVLYFMAIFFHGGAIAALGLIPLYFISQKIDYLGSLKYIILFNIIFFSRFVIEVSAFQVLANLYYRSTGLDNFDKYIDEITNVEHLSIVYNILYFIFMNLILLTYHKMKPIFKFASLAILVKIMMSAFLTGTVQRILQYYHIYDIILVPYLFFMINTYRKEYKFVYACRYIIGFVALFLIIYDFMKTILVSEYYNRWPEFKTIFEAPQWL